MTYSDGSSRVSPLRKKIQRFVATLGKKKKTRFVQHLKRLRSRDGDCATHAALNDERRGGATRKRRDSIDFIIVKGNTHTWSESFEKPKRPLQWHERQICSHTNKHFVLMGKPYVTKGNMIFLWKVWNGGSPKAKMICIVNSFPKWVF